MKELLLNLLVGSLLLLAAGVFTYVLVEYLRWIVLVFGALIAVGIVISAGAIVRGVWRDVDERKTDV